MKQKNYIDEKGNYQNVENLTLAQIYNEGVKAGIAISKMIKRNNEMLRKPKDAKAIKTLEDELNHAKQHLEFKDMAPEYYQEMREYIEALETAIEAIKERNTASGGKP